jgi:hypothetical protein
VCVRARARVCVCVCACVRACVCVYVSVGALLPKNQFVGSANASSPRCCRSIDCRPRVVEACSSAFPICKCMHSIIDTTQQNAGNDVIGESELA